MTNNEIFLATKTTEEMLEAFHKLELDFSDPRVYEHLKALDTRKINSGYKDGVISESF